MDVSNIDGRLAQSYKLGVEVPIGDKVYKTIIKNSIVVWEEVVGKDVNDLDIEDSVLDEFDINSHTFFLIGNETNCRPCSNAVSDIKLYSEIENNDITYKKWLYDMDTNSVIGKEKVAWCRREKSRDDKYGGWNTIPAIWYKGKFIGGHNELKDILIEEFISDES